MCHSFIGWDGMLGARRTCRLFSANFKFSFTFISLLVSSVKTSTTTMAAAAAKSQMEWVQLEILRPQTAHYVVPKVFSLFLGRLYVRRCCTKESACQRNFTCERSAMRNRFHLLRTNTKFNARSDSVDCLKLIMCGNHCGATANGCRK